MLLVEKHIIKKNHKFFKELDFLAFQSKNLYNSANYLIRQAYFKILKEQNIKFSYNYLQYNSLYHKIKSSLEYKALPAKVSNSILMMLDKNWKSFIKATKEYFKNPSKFKSIPNMPQYKDKLLGRNIVIYNIQAINKKYLKNNILLLSKTNIKISSKINFKNIKEVRIIPRLNQYNIEIVYEKEIKINHTSDKNKSLAIDIGVNNISAISFNFNKRPIIINGKPLKSINHFYNKKLAILKSFIKKGTSNKIRKLINKRNNKINNFLHYVSKYIIQLSKEYNISKIIIGKNDNWKQNCNIGKINNQNFVSIPYNKLFQMLEYKAKLYSDIEIIYQEESYTSICSFLDLEEIKKHEFYKGSRNNRLFYSSNKTIIHSDVNGSYNILRKSNNMQPEIIKQVQAMSVKPIKLNLNSLIKINL